MVNAKKALILSAALVCALSFTGCYTQLMSYQGQSMHGRPSDGNACADCQEEVPFANTRREVCVWQRDIFGYPELRCYNTAYHSSWVYFHNTPWWYRSSFGWHDSRGCPPHYYFDRFTGMCRLIGPSRYPPANPGSSGGGSGQGQPRPPRPQVRSIPSEHAETVEPAVGTADQQPMFGGGGLRPLSPVGAPIQQQPPPPQPPPQQSDGGLTKPADDGSGHAPPPPNREPNQRPPRPSSRGM
jgi:hypothetical protein